MKIISFQKLTVDSSIRDVILLGYPLDLTDSEYGIVSFLCSAPEAGVSREELCALCKSPSSLNVHICNINKKAFVLSGRKLITYTDKRYKLNENL